MLRLGVIDLGTNSIRLLIADANEGGIHPLVKRAKTTRLGYNLDKTGVISAESIEKTIEAIKEYKKLIKTYGADEILAIATSAVRSAQNRDEVVRRISEESELEIAVLSGEEEAKLGYLGVRTQYGDDEPMLVVDIGGGSTEFSLCYHDDILYQNSVQIGSVRLTEKFITSYPIADTAIESMKEYIKESINKTIKDIANISKDFKMVSIGGTATTLSILVNGMERIENSSLYINDVKDIIEDFKHRDIESMRSIDLIEKGRHDIIFAGAVELMCILEYLDIERTYVTMRDSLEGVAAYRANYI